MNNKRWVRVLMGTMLTSGLLVSACAPKAAEPAATPQPEAKGSEPAAKSAGPVSITMARAGSPSAIPKEDFVKKELDAKLGINFKLDLTDDKEHANKLSVLAASQNLPDLLEIKEKDLSVYYQMARNGLLLDLTPYLDKLGAVKKQVGEEGFTKGKVDGKVFGFSQAPRIVPQGFWIRKDWLDKLGLKSPTTMDELLEVAKAFTEKDPDGNGKKDTYGISGTREIERGFLGVHGTTEPNKFYIQDGKLINSLYDPNMKKGIEEFQRFLKAGVVDPELFTNKVTDVTDKAAKGFAGIFYEQWAGLVRDEHVKKMKEINPNAELVLLPALQGAKNVRFNDVGQITAIIAIPKKLEKDPEKLNKVFELLNYVSEGDGANLVYYGQKDVHWKQEGDKIVLTEKKGEASYTWLYQLTGRPEMDYLMTKFPPQAALIKESSALPELKVYNGFVIPPKGFNVTDANRFIGEEMLKFYTGKAKVEDYDAFLASLEKTFNFKVYLEEADKTLKGLGYVK
ncbi:extracellular solute-binding protein [Paenibacillus sp. S-38]|uniref:extracellular solute-binding protein n=1 Tax=Paenibacillus sp. S-38 TaxID=3416710 RepID=UPI003CF3ABAF